MHPVYEISDTPWCYEYIECNDAGCIRIRQDRWIRGNRCGHYVATVDKCSDAQLMAAAPDLLAAAKAALNNLPPDAPKHIREQLEQAIAKAIYPIGGVGYAERDILVRIPKYSQPQIKEMMTALAIPSDMGVMSNMENVLRIFDNTYRVLRQGDNFFSVYSHESQEVSGSLTMISYWLWIHQP